MSSQPDLRARIRPLPADTAEAVFVPFVDLCFNWSMDRPAMSRGDLLTRADARHYFADWGRPGDLAVACLDEDGEEIVGLAWLRLAPVAEAIDGEAQPRDVAFSAGLHATPGRGAGAARDADATDAVATDAEDTTASADEDSAPFAGYGWVAAEIPELSIAVLPADQGQGIGRALLEALLALARMTGVGAVSLAVEDGNEAKNLCTDLGFVPVGRNGDSDLLVRRLR